MNNVINVPKNGVLRVTRFTSNSKKLLVSITENRRKFKFSDFLGDVSAEKALDIQWNIPKDNFSFNIKMNRKKLTKKVMLSIISTIYNHLVWPL